MGIDNETLADLPLWRDSDRFTELEKLALDLAERMSRTPAEVPDELRAQLLQHLSMGQFAELVSAIAWENHRARMNRAFGARSMGFSDGAFCVLPDRGSNPV